MLSLVIFDCDGVLFDSWRANVAYYNAVLQELGQPPLDPEWSRRAHFMASSQLFDVLFASDLEQARRAREIARTVDYAPFYELMQPAPDLALLLGDLKGRYRLAMASNRGKTVPEIMHRFGLDAFLELAVGVLDVARPKPFPDMIEKCLVHFGVPAAETVYVGDAESDLAAARAAGVRFLAVGEQDWAPEGIRHLQQLPQRLREWAESE